MVDEVSSTWCELMAAIRRHETVPRSFSAEVDSSFIPFALCWSTNYDLDIIPQQGLERFPELRRSSKTGDEAASKHSASFTVQFHVIVSQLFDFFILYGLIGPVGKLLHSLWRAESWADSFQRWFVSDRISPLSDLRSLSRYDHAKANGREGKLQLLERGRARRGFTWWRVLFRPYHDPHKIKKKAFIYKATLCSARQQE